MDPQIPVWGFLFFEVPAQASTGSGLDLPHIRQHRGVSSHSSRRQPCRWQSQGGNY